VSASTDALQLLDWRRRVSALYRAIRTSDDPAAAWAVWRAGRDALFRDHPQSPLPAVERATHRGLSYYPYDPAARALAEVVDVPAAARAIGASDGAAYPFTRFGTARFTVYGRMCELALYWLSGYGGGLFLPFRDRTAGAETYGGGRYLLDTVKGADLGTVGDRLVLDFNFAYNPSCAYDPIWSCPLAPPESRVPVALPCGERVATPAAAVDGGRG
jgi:uncharacterized protein